MKNNLAKPLGFCISIILSSVSISCPASETKTASVKELWDLVQKQQIQIESQRQQIESQNKAIKSMSNYLSIDNAELNLQAQKKMLTTDQSFEVMSKVGSDQTMPVKDKSSHNESKYSFKGYAVANYFNYDWQTNPDRRDSTDLERLVLNGKYKFNDQWSLVAEIEYEHGGTGSTIEFDVFEEFGEFEQEIEKGGEVIVEELFLQYDYQPWLSVRAGEIPVPVGLINKRHRPSHYFTTTRSEGETAMIPVAWHELGIELRGHYGGFLYRGQIITGLDSTGFSSANWVKRGFQKRFEHKNANNLAFVASVDYDFSNSGFDFLEGAQIGTSFYWGNTTDNRPKPDLKEDANVSILSLYGLYEKGPWIFRASTLYGQLSNADLVSAANRRLPNSLGVKRSPIAKAALAWSIETGYDLFNLLPIEYQSYVPGYRFDWFFRYDDYDTMEKTAGLIFDNPRWDREVFTTGFNYAFIKGVMLKGQYSHRNLNISDDNIENTFSMGIAAEF